MTALWKDLRYAARSLSKRPLFTAVAVLTLALGIGANTAIFSVINDVMLRQPPYEDPERLVMLRLSETGSDIPEPEPMPWAYPVYEDLRKSQTSFQDVAAFAGWYFNLTGSEVPERIPVEIVSAQYFPLLGLRAEHGRVFLPEEDRTKGAHPVALISYELWRRRFGADPDLQGKQVFLESQPLTVVGVLPRGFKGLTGQAEVWVPMMMAPELMMPRRLEMRFAQWHEVVGRLKPGVTAEQADRELATFFAQQRQEYAPEATTVTVARAVSLREDKVDPALGKALLLLFAAVGLVLLIACVNVVNLLLVRAAARQKESAIRVALGSDRKGLVRLFMAESLLLGALGGVAGAFLAFLGVRMAAVFSPVSVNTLPFGAASSETIPLGSVHLGFRVLAVNFLIALLAGAVLGLLPALQAARSDINAWVKQGVGGLASNLQSLRRASPLSFLVVMEIALSLLLLVGAGLMIRSFAQLYSTRLGFEPAQLLTLRVSHPFKSDFGPDRTLFYEQLVKSAQALPGVEAVTLTNRLPLSISGEKSTVTVQGRPLPAGAEAPQAGVHMVGTGHFDTLRIRLLQGRKFSELDRQGAPRVAILNATAARRFFPGENPLGRRIHLGIGWEDEEYAEVVGMVDDVRYGKIEEAPEPDVYVPFAQAPHPFVFLLLRSRTAPETLIPEIRQTVLRLDRDIPVYDIKTMEQRIADTTSKIRFGTFLLTAFAALACLLAAVGLYGVIAYSVSGRTREIGIRMALGASSSGVAGMVVRDGLLLAAVGLAIGLGLAAASSRVLANFLYQLSAMDPATFAGAALLLLVVSLAASYIPARRALKVDPKVALQYE
jgi:putative ABC transport system permease protein